MKRTTPLARHMHNIKSSPSLATVVSLVRATTAPNMIYSSPAVVGLAKICDATA
jgi:hypothetical protein